MAVSIKLQFELVLLIHGSLKSVLSVDSSCYLQYTSIRSTPLHHFTLPPGNHCWDYCKYLDTCQTFSFPLDDLSSCKLYREGVISLDTTLNTTSLSVVGWKDCLLGTAASSVSSNDQWSQIEDIEVIIQKVDDELCLNVDYGDPDFWDKEEITHQLVWTSRCDGTWNILRVPSELETEDNEDYGCMPAIIQLRDSALCVTTTKDTPFYMSPQAFVMRCRRGDEVLGTAGTGDENWTESATGNQLIVMCPEDAMGKNSWFLVDKQFNDVTLEAGGNLENSSQNFRKISFLKKEDLTKKPAACVEEELEVQHGRVMLDEAAPLILPGEGITVQCDPEFGVLSGHLIEDKYVTFCSEKMELDLCTRVELLDLEQDICRSGVGHRNILDQGFIMEAAFVLSVLQF